MGNVVTERTLNPSPIYDFMSSVRIFLSITAKCSALYHDVLKVWFYRGWYFSKPKFQNFG